jgi:hypothetical protein
MKYRNVIAALICALALVAKAEEAMPWKTVFEDRFDTTESLRNWEVIVGEWSVTTEGLSKHGHAMEAILKLRQPVVSGAVRVEYEAKSDDPGDVSLILGGTDADMMGAGL